MPRAKKPIQRPTKDLELVESERLRTLLDAGEHLWHQAMPVPGTNPLKHVIGDQTLRRLANALSQFWVEIPPSGQRGVPWIGHDGQGPCPECRGKGELTMLVHLPEGGCHLRQLPCFQCRPDALVVAHAELGDAFLTYATVAPLEEE